MYEFTDSNKTKSLVLNCIKEFTNYIVCCLISQNTKSTEVYNIQYKDEKIHKYPKEIRE